MKKTCHFGMLYACVCTFVFTSGVASANTINVTDVFRFIRTDVYAESGGVIDHGTQTINGASSPGANQGAFISTRQAEASVSTGSGSASSLARVEVNSSYLLGESSLVFDVAGTLSLDTNTQGDGFIQNPLPDVNCCRSFSFLNHFIYFDITEAYAYSIDGTGAAGSWLLFNLDTQTLVATGPANGVLQPGSYRYTVRDDIEVTGATTISDDHSFDTTFHLTAVPAPSAIWLFGSGLLGLLGNSKRQLIAKNGQKGSGYYKNCI